MNFGLGDIVHGVESGINAVGDGVEHLADSGEKLVGSAVEHVAGGAASLLDRVGLHAIADDVENLGDDIADHLGADVPEKQLGQTDDPKELIHGDVGAINQVVDHLAKFEEGLGKTGGALRSIDVAGWKGEAGAAFHERYQGQPKQWMTASDAMAGARGALSGYVQTLQWAQGQAREAIALYQEGKQASDRARNAYNAEVDSYNTAALAYNASGGRGVRPTPPGAFVDPGTELIERARAMLKTARAQRDEASAHAASAITAATSAAPKQPGFLDRMLADGSDTLTAGSVGGQHFVGGAVTAVGDLVKTVRALNPNDPYNITHPAAYVAGVADFGAGITHMATHPAEFGKSLIGTGWSSDPFQAVGALVPQVAAAAATDGASEAGVVAGEVAERAAVSGSEQALVTGGERAAADAGESAARQAAGDTREVARPPESRVCENDPVDVATGAVTLPQTDVELDGVLPLQLGRNYLSNFRAGRWFGPGWASTIDQRLEIDSEGVLFVSEGAMMLTYPHPASGQEVLPVEGPRWPLSRGEDGTYRIVDLRRGRTLHFRSQTPGDIGSAPVVTVPLSAVTDRTHNRILFRHDRFGLPIEVVHSGGYRILVDTEDGRIAALRLATPSETAPNSSVLLTSFGYVDGQLSQVINSSGSALEFGYDERVRLAHWRDRNGTEYRYFYDDLDRCIHQYGPDGVMEATFDYRPVDPENPLRGFVTTMVDSTGCATQYRINRARQVVAITDARGGRTSMTFDRFDRVLSRTDPLGNVTRYRYDTAGDVTEVVRPDGARITASYAFPGRPSRIREADGSEWTYEYDAFRNTAEVHAPDRTTTRIERDETGAARVLIDELGARTEIGCDAAGLPIAVTNPLRAVTRYERDAFGRIIAVVEPNGDVARLEWTVEGRIAARTGPDGARETWVYDAEGNLVEHVDAAGARVRTEYGHFDVPVAQVGPDGARTEYAYDAARRLTAVTNPQGLVWTYDYDNTGRVVAETDFAGAVHRYGYDLAGRLETRSVGESVVGYRYDALGNRIEETTAEGVTRYAFDPTGRLVSAVTSDAELTLERDRLGRVVAEVCNGRRIENRYDAAGRRIGRRTPAGVETRWRRDGAGLIVETDCDGHRMTVIRDAVGRETSRTLGQRLSLDLQWHAGRLVGHSVVAGRSSLDLGEGITSGRVLTARKYEYRIDGALARVEDQLRGSRAFDLDAAGRVTSVVGDGRESYGYDVAGNLTSASVPNLFGGAAEPADAEYRGMLLMRSGRSRFRYDERGRVIGKTVTRLSKKPEQWAYRWDAEDRLREVVTPDGSVWRYRYDAFGRRIAKVGVAADGAVLSETVFTWDGDRLVEESDGGEVTTWDYEGEGFTPLAQSRRRIDADSDGQRAVDAEFFAIVTDLMGSPAELIDTERGAVAGRSVSSLWGRTAWSGEASTPLRFPGQYFDDESGLHYNRYRYYEPGTGRYLTLDPLGLAPAPNPVTYPHNPTGWVDPLGLAPCRPTGDYPETPVGRPGYPLDVAPGTNAPRVIDGREFSGHALDRMQGRGIPLSAVDETITHGVPYPSRGGTTIHYDPNNNISVVINANGRVVTVSQGRLGGVK